MLLKIYIIINFTHRYLFLLLTSKLNYIYKYKFFFFFYYDYLYEKQQCTKHIMIFLSREEYFVYDTKRLG